jgi:hypothetical protein
MTWREKETLLEEKLAQWQPRRDFLPNRLSAFALGRGEQTLSTR